MDNLNISVSNFFRNGRADGQSNIFNDVARKIFAINNYDIFFHDLQINKH